MNPIIFFNFFSKQSNIWLRNYMSNIGDIKGYDSRLI